MADQLAFFLYEGGVIPEEHKSGITRVRIGQNVTEISEGAFFAFGNPPDNLNEGLQIGPPGLFRSCTALNFANLVEVHFNEGLWVIGAAAFLGCIALQRVVLPSTVSQLSIGEFKWRNKLTNVQLNEGLQFVGEQAFHSCHELRSVTIPATVTSLGRQASFCNCSNLSEVIFLGSERLLNLETLAHYRFGEEGVLNQEAIDKLFEYWWDSRRTFYMCF